MDNKDKIYLTCSLLVFCEFVALFTFMYYGHFDLYFSLKDTPPALQQKIDKFEKIYNVETDTHAFFSEDMLEGRTAARCFQDTPFRGDYIVVREQYKEKPKQLWMILLHELGHCHFKMKHRDKHILYNKRILPGSLMNTPLYLENSDWKKLKPYYLRELVFPKTEYQPEGEEIKFITGLNRREGQ